MKVLKELALGSALTLALTALAACENIALIGRPSLVDLEDEVVGEVERVDTRDRAIYIRPERGRTGMVSYSEDARVIDRGREHPITYLQTGDIVAMQLKKDSRGTPYTTLVRIQQSGRGERTGSVGSSRTGSLQTLDGTVERVDEQRGSFEVRDRDGRQVTVHLPFNARRSDIDRLQRLRIGDRITVEGQFIGQDRFELEAFLT